MNDGEYMLRVRAMEGKLFRIAQAMLWRYPDCADAVQEAVFRGWLRKEKIRQAEFFETWLIRILINECKDQLRRCGREKSTLLMEISAEDRMCEDLHLRMALKSLPEKYRLPLVLHYLEGYAVKEVADMLEISTSKATSRLHTARQKLKSLLDGGAE